MAAWAQTHDGYDAIHILSHGAQGTLQLGRDTVTQSSLSDAGVQAELATLGQALMADGDLLIYGCSVAAGEAGQAFVANLAAATGADVAASDDATGSVIFKGDWNLEIQLGQISPRSIFDNQKLQAYTHSLAAAPSTTSSFVVGSNQTLVSATSTSPITYTNIDGWDVSANFSSEQYSLSLIHISHILRELVAEMAHKNAWMW